MISTQEQSEAPAPQDKVWSLAADPELDARAAAALGGPTPSTATPTQPVKALDQSGLRKGKPLR
jgi:hypothetical protein